MRKKSIYFFIGIVILLFLVCLNTTVLFPRKYSEYVKEYSQKYNVNENLIYAIIKCESDFDKNAVSHAGVIGLMQITPQTLQWAALKNKDFEVSLNSLADPETNIKYGCYIYSLLQAEFSDSTVSLAAYNAGRGNVLKWLNDKRYSDDGILLKRIPFRETQKYTSKVLIISKIYDFIY